MFCNLLKLSLRGKNRPCTPQSRLSAPPCLEELESRLVPSGITVATNTNASVQVIPNLSSLTVTEKVTASVTNAPTFNPLTGLTTPVPPGTPNPPGTVFFNLNNQQQQANLDRNGQGTATFTLPLVVLFTSQELTVRYPGASVVSPSALSYTSSTFNAPLYLNFDNLVFAATVTFNPLSAQQMASTSGVPSYNTAQGETDDFGPLSFQYADPGVITSIHVFGNEFPGIFAAAVGAYGPEFMKNGGSS